SRTGASPPKVTVKVVFDECHRGYNLDQEMSDSELEFRSEAEYISKYRRVIDHFDAVRKLERPRPIGRRPNIRSVDRISPASPPE
ncbi:hypothetical protein AB1L30_00155, partial [Bremerella sp. JC817]|uniref:hypothetical protein n=1 Tax=Bremerella sp. JC817 TaxID=3231756 RepID=UPI0034593EEF